VTLINLFFFPSCCLTFLPSPSPPAKPPGTIVDHTSLHKPHAWYCTSVTFLIGVPCSAAQCTAVRCNVLQCVAVWRILLMYFLACRGCLHRCPFWCLRRDVWYISTSRIVRIHWNVCAISLRVATHGNTPQHTAAHYNTLQRTATQCVHIHQSNYVPTLQHARIKSRDGATDATHAEKCHTARQCVHIHQSSCAHALQHAHASHMFECTRPLGM